MQAINSVMPYINSLDNSVYSQVLVNCTLRRQEVGRGRSSREAQGLRPVPAGICDGVNENWAVVEGLLTCWGIRWALGFCC